MTSLHLYNRQHSSTSSDSNQKKIIRLKYRRCSSVDDRNLLKIENKEKMLKKDDIIASDDSGIEDSDQQMINLSTNQVQEDEEEEEEKKENNLTFQACPNEDEIDNSTSNDEQQDFQRLLDDLELTAKISHEEKKEFCLNTSEVFHGEFARLIAHPVAINFENVYYYLFAEDEVYGDPCYWPYFAYLKLDNAKAQFKCPNSSCCHLWTSMRGRISFKISFPHRQGFVVLKIFRQNCNRCETPSDALWYIEEVCRVMENLARSIFEKLFFVDTSYLQNENMIASKYGYPKRSRHDPHQRSGNMRAPHDRRHCEACRFGLCFY